MLRLHAGGLITVWVVIIVRATLAITRGERALLTAVTSLCALTTLYNPYVADWLNQLVGVNAGDVIRHVISIVTAAIMVSFAIAQRHRERVPRWIIAGAVTVFVLMLVRYPARFVATMTGTERNVDYNLYGWWAVGYFTLLGSYCVAALIATIIEFAAATRVIDTCFIRASLWLICISLALNAIPWITTVVWLVTGGQFWTSCIPTLDEFNLFFLAASLSIPAAGTIWARVQAARTARRLRPFWLALTKSVPDVVLRKESRRWRYNVQRMVIELRDCLLILGAYVEEADLAIARQQAGAMLGANNRRDAIATALAVRRAQTNKDAGRSASLQKVPLTQSSSTATLDDDLAELFQIAQAYDMITTTHRNE